MAGRPFHFIFVGKLKHRFIQEGTDLYLERLKVLRKVLVHIVKDADPRLSEEQRKGQEAERIMKALQPEDIPIVLDERGQELHSAELAKMIKGFDDEARGTPCFIIGGPYGFAPRVRESGHALLSLSRMTMPHELARLLLLEQLYRAETILRKIPYHH